MTLNKMTASEVLEYMRKWVDTEPTGYPKPATLRITDKDGNVTEHPIMITFMDIAPVKEPEKVICPEASSRECCSWDNCDHGEPHVSSEICDTKTLDPMKGCPRCVPVSEAPAPEEDDHITPGAWVVCEDFWTEEEDCKACPFSWPVQYAVGLKKETGKCGDEICFETCSGQLKVVKCPTAEGCDSSNKCPHAKPHVSNEWCNERLNDGCPGCVEVMICPGRKDGTRQGCGSCPCSEPHVKDVICSDEDEKCMLCRPYTVDDMLQDNVKEPDDPNADLDDDDPEWMICPRIDNCEAASLCKHATQHEKGVTCDSYAGMCVPCVPWVPKKKVVLPVSKIAVTVGDRDQEPVRCPNIDSDKPYSLPELDWVEAPVKKEPEVEAPEMMICDHADKCGYIDCDARVPHKRLFKCHESWCIIARVLVNCVPYKEVEKPEAAPKMVKCPGPTGGKNWTCDGCFHKGLHLHTPSAGCDHKLSLICPPCAGEMEAAPVPETKLDEEGAEADLYICPEAIGCAYRACKHRVPHEIEGDCDEEPCKRLDAPNKGVTCVRWPADLFRSLIHWACSELYYAGIIGYLEAAKLLGFKDTTGDLARVDNILKSAVKPKELKMG